MEVIWRVREERKSHEMAIVRRILERDGIVSDEMLREEFLNKSVFDLISKLGEWRLTASGPGARQPEVLCAHSNAA